MHAISPSEAVKLCNCEHTNHFADEFGPQTMHNYRAVTCSSAHVSDIGPICYECANTCMAPYLDK